jgi:hypothetical protein
MLVLAPAALALSHAMQQRWAKPALTSPANWPYAD